MTLRSLAPEASVSAIPPPRREEAIQRRNRPDSPHCSTDDGKKSKPNFISALVKKVLASSVGLAFASEYASMSANIDRDRIRK